MAAKKKGKKVRTYRVRVDEDMDRAIEEVVEQKGESASVILREAVREYLARLQQEKNDR